MSEHLKHPFKEDNTVYTMGMASTLGPFSRYNSSSRMQMVTGHRSHEVTPINPDLDRIMTGFEPQLSEFCFCIKMPCDAEIISVHNRYLTGRGYDGIANNPSVTVIYQNNDTGEYDAIDIFEYFTTHTSFGIRFNIAPIVRTLRPGVMIRKGTILAEAPTQKDGIYRNGLHAEVIYFSDPAADEDGFRISEEFAERARPLEMDSVVGEWGKHSYPLNIYGDENVYKPHPDIGDKLRDDGIVFATRTYDEVFDAIDMLPRNLRRIDYIHDKRIYASDMGGAEVHDVKVESGIGEARVKVKTPAGMEQQSLKYINGLSLHHEGILRTYNELCRRHRGGRNIAINPRLQKKIVRALADEPNTDKSHFISNARREKNQGLVRRTYKSAPLDEYRVEVFFHKWKKIGLGSKFTDNHGCKGVVCAVSPNEEMPVDQNGNRADVVIFTKSTVSRLNTGQLKEQFINAASRDLSIWIRNSVGKLPHEKIWSRLMAYYHAVSPRMFKELERAPVERQQSHVQSIVEDGIYLIISPDDSHLSDIRKLYHDIMAVIQPTYGPVSFINHAGQREVTKEPALIGGKHFMVLQQTDYKPMAVSSGKIQHHGLLGGVTRESRNSHPIKQQAQRAIGETEGRLYAATMGADAVAEQMDLSNNPDSIRSAIETILNANDFKDMEHLVDRTKTPLGNSRALQYILHFLRGYGIEVVEEVYNDNI